MLKRRFVLIGSTVISFTLLVVGCEDFLNPEDEKPIAPPGEVALNTTITEGPADGASLLYYSSPTFRWKGEVSPGYVAGFKWTFEKDNAEIDASSDWTMEMTKTFANLGDGSYTFTVWAKDDKDSVDATPATRSFTVLETDSIGPVIRFLQSPTDGSDKPPGANIFFEWSASDSSTFGSVAGYSHRLSGTGTSATDWTSWNLNTTTAAFSHLQLGDYTFQVIAKDNAGVIGDTAEVDFHVKTPTILVVDDYVPGSDSPFLDEIATDNIVGDILRDWSWEEWDVSDRGDWPSATDLAGYSSVIWYVDEGPYMFYYSSKPDTDASYIANPLINYLDNGGNLWLMGGEILYYSAAGDTGDIFAAGRFAADYLHLSDGGDAGDNEFTGLTSLGVAGFDDIGIPGLATGTGWPDELTAASDATAIYDLGGYDTGTTAGILYDGSDYNVVFWAVNFAFVATNHNHLTLAPGDMYPVANHILETIFGE